MDRPSHQQGFSTPNGIVPEQERLAKLLEGSDGPIHYSDHFVGKGEALFEKFCGGGLEGRLMAEQPGQEAEPFAADEQG